MTEKIDQFIVIPIMEIIHGVAYLVGVLTLGAPVALGQGLNLAAKKAAQNVWGV